MNVRPVRESDYPALKELFCEYYAELDCEDDPLSLFDEYLLPDLKAALFEVLICETDEKPIGFVIFQIDDVINDWHFKEGAGDLRELYVARNFRGRGFGGELVRRAEERLKELGATEIYTLPVEECEAFFIKRGYADAGEYCGSLDNKVFAKKV